MVIALAVAAVVGTFNALVVVRLGVEVIIRVLCGLAYWKINGPIVEVPRW
ncbi:MAG: hypothetical protein M0008_02880 [Actinomycetota bacterium]|nr:hypothetical protein [Actinomycetota bacterium]